MKRINLSLGRLYPRRYRDKIGALLNYGGSDVDARPWLGNILVLNLLLLVAVNLVLLNMGTPQEMLLVLIAANASIILLVQSLAYVLPYYAAERRAKAVEAVLPGFYQLVSSYLRSGMTPYQALKSASKKEFGVLKEELDIATSKALGTQSFSDALLDISTRIKSDNLQRSTELMVRGMDSGGSLAKMLEESAANLVENKSLRRQIVTASRTYTLMVIFAVVIGGPLLLSISTRFNERLVDLTQSINTDVTDIQGLQLGLISADVNINPDILFNIALFTIFMTSLISSFLVGIIVEGKEKYGFKYATFFVPLSIAFFYIFRIFLTSFF